MPLGVGWGLPHPTWTRGDLISEETSPSGPLLIREADSESNFVSLVFRKVSWETLLSGPGNERQVYWLIFTIFLPGPIPS